MSFIESLLREAALRIMRELGLYQKAVDPMAKVAGLMREVHARLDALGVNDSRVLAIIERELALLRMPGQLEELAAATSEIRDAFDARTGVLGETPEASETTIIVDPVTLEESPAKK